jgi:hypothetical protein
MALFTAKPGSKENLLRSSHSFWENKTDEKSIRTKKDLKFFI